MKLGMINSAWEQHGVGLVDGLHKTKELGFDCVEVFQDPLDANADARQDDTPQSRCWRPQMIDQQHGPVTQDAAASSTASSTAASSATASLTAAVCP